MKPIYALLHIVGFAALMTSLSCTCSPNKDAIPSGSPTEGTTDAPVKQGLLKEDLLLGSGEEAVNNSSVKVHYTGRFMDGKKFDSSVDRGQPFQFTLGKGQVIKGWDQGILGMKVGGKRNLTIPPHLAYGERGAGSTIPSNTTLKFEVELIWVEPASK